METKKENQLLTAAAQPSQKANPLTDPDVVREAIEATFEQRPGYMVKVAAAVRALDQAAPAPQQSELSNLPEYQRVREEFELAVTMGHTFCINSAMLNVDALLRANKAAPAPQQSDLLGEVLQVLQMVANELSGTSFSQHKVREGNSDVWRYIGRGEEVARRVREVLAKAAPAAPVQTAKPTLIDMMHDLMRFECVLTPEGKAEMYASETGAYVWFDHVISTIEGAPSLAAPVQADKEQK